MVRQLEAVYEQGVLRPLEPLALPENQRVRLTLDDQPELPPSQVEPSPLANARREEMLWLATQASPYAGEWVALNGSRLVAHGAQLSVVRAAADAAGEDEPFYARIEKDQALPFGGW